MNEAECQFPRVWCGWGNKTHAFTESRACWWRWAIIPTIKIIRERSQGGSMLCERSKQRYLPIPWNARKDCPGEVEHNLKLRNSTLNAFTSEYTADYALTLTFVGLCHWIQHNRKKFAAPLFFRVNHEFTETTRIWCQWGRINIITRCPRDWWSVVCGLRNNKL